MSLDASDFLEAALALPAAVRKDIALRLLESVDVVDDDSVNNAWANEIVSRVQDAVTGKVPLVPGEQVFAGIEARLAARE